MILNFAREKAAINQLCQLYNISLDVHPFNLDEPSQDFTKAPALSDENFSLALLEGAKRVPESADILCLGEMGIGNTTAAAALAFALHFKNNSDDPLIWCGKGTGISQEQRQYKALIVKNAVEFHAPSFLNLPPHTKPISILQRLGGFEFVALTGAILKARILRIPTITDGYAASMPLAILHAINPELISHVRVAHLSQEPGHAQILSSLNISPLLDLNLRLGEASGAALATTLCDAALACHNHMGTFSETLTAQKL
jgi:nicotinate-nucleotide--dimethylbenzimidazole phosphoribosyltransferase